MLRTAYLDALRIMEASMVPGSDEWLHLQEQKKRYAHDLRILVDECMSSQTFESTEVLTFAEFVRWLSTNPSIKLGDQVCDVLSVGSFTSPHVLKPLSEDEAESDPHEAGELSKPAAAATTTSSHE
mmetsp:Transcript_46149/g.116211  ORF Transcript_46149/g.116211 Transcript_46149/m.116211 type:complete len:126 (+) Transcript_46149:210-587(+)